MKLINVFGDFFTARFAVSATALFASFRTSIDDVVNLGRASPCLSIFQKKQRERPITRLLFGTIFEPEVAVIEDGSYDF